MNKPRKCTIDPTQQKGYKKLTTLGKASKAESEALNTINVLWEAPKTPEDIERKAFIRGLDMGDAGYEEFADTCVSNHKKLKTRAEEALIARNRLEIKLAGHVIADQIKELKNEKKALGKES